jgi:hypothetical protein
MRTHRRSTLRTAVERALLERDRREIASIERLMKVLHLEEQRRKRRSSPQRTQRNP